MGARPSVNRDAALLQQLAEKSCREVSGVLDGECLAEPSIVLGNVAPEGELVRTRLAIDGDGARARALRRRHHAVINLVVLGKRRDVEERALARTVRGF